MYGLWGAVEGFALSTDCLRSAAPRFTAEGQRLAQALADLRIQLDALGRPWGDDPQLQAFAAQYEANRPIVERATDLLSQGVRSIGDCLAASADNHDGHEAAATSAR